MVSFFFAALAALLPLQLGAVDVELAMLATESASGACGIGRLCPATVSTAGHPPVDATTVRDVWPELRERCALTGVVPDAPDGVFVRWNIDGAAAVRNNGDRDGNGNGDEELVFAGGCDPEPFFVIFHWRNGGWKQWHRQSGRLIKIFHQFDITTIVSLVDGYGVSRDAWVSIVRYEGRLPAVTTRFRAVEPLDPVDDGTVAAIGLADGWPDSVVTVEAKAGVALRAAAVVNDRPDESGMGFDYPGNLIQKYGKKSRAIVMREKNGVDNRNWLLVLMPDRPAARANVVRAMQMPWSPPWPGAVAGGSWVWGWVPVSAVQPAKPHR